MTKPIIRIHDVETNQIIDREMNADELAKYQIIQNEYANILEEERAKATAKADLLAKLGITEDEAKLLLS